jgi:hypothetical protein
MVVVKIDEWRVMREVLERIDKPEALVRPAKKTRMGGCRASRSPCAWTEHAES